MCGTRRQSSVRRLLAVLWLVLAPAIAVAQTQPPPETSERDFTHGTVAGMLGGVSFEESQAHPILGGMVGWTLTGKWTVEVSAAWSDRANDTTAFSAALSLRRSFPTGHAVMPYLKAGAALYIETADQSRDANFSASNYRFNDPAALVGAGASWSLSRRFAIRPEVETLIVWNGSQSTTITSVVALLEYHFDRSRTAP